MKKLLLLPILLLFLFSNAKENPGAPKKSNIPSVSSVANCAPGTALIDLNINKVRAGLLAGADMWWDINNPKYEVPVGSGKHSLFAGSLWIGGIDQGGQILVAAQTYRQTGDDFWPGAMDTTIVDITSTRCADYNRFWKINRQEVLDFVANGTTTPDIISWPGNGNSLSNEGQYLAPFVDVNADGIYNHLDGDYPGYKLTPGPFPTVPGTIVQQCDDYLFGQQTVWWVINDVGNVHTETSSQSMGLEIRCQAFAYPSLFASLDHATFYKYQIINRSSATYNQTYLGMWVDPDLGLATDDYVGCDVTLGLGYCYNGDTDDETAAGYGIDPPAVGIDFLRGPDADSGDGIDNDKDGCVDCTAVDSAGVILIIPESVLRESIIMSKFIYYNNLTNMPTGNPAGFTDFYNYLQGIWLDNQPITYGGDGRNPTAPVCNFMFPGTTDSALFATEGAWDEIIAGNAPGDRRFIQSAGPFTLEPGEVNYVTISALWARQTGGGPLGSVNLLKQFDADIQHLFSNCFDSAGVGIEETIAANSVVIYPNPSSDFISMDMNLPAGSKTMVDVFNAKGEIVISEQITNSKHHQIETMNLAAGNYFLRISVNGKAQHYSKVAIVKP